MIGPRRGFILKGLSGDLYSAMYSSLVSLVKYIVSVSGSLSRPRNADGGYMEVMVSDDGSEP